MNPVLAYLHNFFFNIYPYICLAVFLMGSLARFDRDQYTRKSDSSQMLRTGTLRWGSNLFHIEDFVAREMAPQGGTDPGAPPAAGGALIA